MTSGSEQELLRVLRSIEARLERLEATVAPASEVPKMLGTLTDIADEWAAKTGDMDARVMRLGELTERMTRPATLKTLGAIVDLAESAPDQIATAMDIFDEMMMEASESDLELHRIADNLKFLALGVLKAATSPQLRGVLDSGMLDPKALTMVGLAARSLADANETEPEQVGAWGALRALRRSNTRRAVGFLMRVAENLGAGLKRDDKRLPA